jgi:hypothetical protein
MTKAQLNKKWLCQFDRSLLRLLNLTLHMKYLYLLNAGSTTISKYRALLSHNLQSIFNGHSNHFVYHMLSHLHLKCAKCLFLVILRILFIMTSCMQLLCLVCAFSSRLLQVIAFWILGFHPKIVTLLLIWEWLCHINWFQCLLNFIRWLLGFPYGLQYYRISVISWFHHSSWEFDHWMSFALFWLTFSS